MRWQDEVWDELGFDDYSNKADERVDKINIWDEMKSDKKWQTDRIS